AVDLRAGGVHDEHGQRTADARAAAHDLAHLHRDRGYRGTQLDDVAVDLRRRARAAAPPVRATDVHDPIVRERAVTLDLVVAAQVAQEAAAVARAAVVTQHAILVEARAHRQPATAREHAADLLALHRG